MNAELQAYWQAIRDSVCTVCTNGDRRGNCLLDPSLDCVLRLYLPFIVDMVKHVETSQIDKYERELRTIVCGRYMYQIVNGCCGIRADATCVLNQHSPFLVKALKNVGHTVCVSS